MIISKKNDFRGSVLFVKTNRKTNMKISSLHLKIIKPTDGTCHFCEHSLTTALYLYLLLIVTKHTFEFSLFFWKICNFCIISIKFSIFFFKTKRIL